MTFYMKRSPRVSRRVFTIAAISVFIGFSGLAVAQDGLPQPKDDVILTITGEITKTNGEGMASFDRAMLESLGMESISTATPWFTGVTKFEGVPLVKLMAAVGAEGKTLEVVALNDYKVALPISDFAEFGAILALKRDGEYMPIRDKGPLFIVYPYDSDPVLKNQKYYSRSVWQLAKMVVR